jgi:cell division protease FtsH
MNEQGPSSKKQDRGNEKKRQEQSRRQFRFGVSYLITSLILLWLFQVFVLSPLARNTEIPYSEFKRKLADAQIVKVTIGERGIVGEMKSPKTGGSPPVVPFNTIPAPAGDPKLIEELQNANVTYRFERPPNPIGGLLLSYLLPLALLGGFWYMAYRRAGGGAKPALVKPCNTPMF